MELVVSVARQLREVHDFRGYIHLKTIPEASPALIELAGKYADRISINIELPTQKGLNQLAPEKNLERTQDAMGWIREKIDEGRERRRTQSGRAGALEGTLAPGLERKRLGKAVPFATGQSTQMLVGADSSPDAVLLERADLLYRDYRLRRVYYSGFSPIPEPSVRLPVKPPPLVREHRLYQADWLLRFYGFDVRELTSPEQPDLDLQLDPKLAWALKNRAWFPADVNRAPREVLLRVPGLGVRNVERILSARRTTRLRLADLLQLRVPMRKVLPFIVAADHHPAKQGLDSENLRARFLPPPEQLELVFERGPELWLPGPAELETARSGEI
jgi:predicted DNA-binding helix-hairpin-helix protein